MSSRKLRSREIISTTSSAPINPSNAKPKQTSIMHWLGSPSKLDCEKNLAESDISTRGCSSSSSSDVLTKVTSATPKREPHRLKKPTNSTERNGEDIPAVVLPLDGILTCDVPNCNYKTSFKGHFERHQKVKHELKRPDCDKTTVCGKTVKCSKCDFRAVNKQEIRRHNYSHETEKMYTCPSPGCDFRTKTAYTFREHVRRHDVEAKKEFQCPLCSKLFWTRTQLQKHIPFHTKEKIFSCSHCNFATCYASNLVAHKRKHAKKSFKTADKQNTQGSLGVSSNEQSILTSCTENSRSDSSLKGRGNILQNEATEQRLEPYAHDKPKAIKKRRKTPTKILEKKHKCDHCNFTAAYKCKIIRHAVVHRDPDDKIHSCSFTGCDFRTNWEDYLKKHCTEVHKSTPDHLCPVEGCGFQTKWKYTLAQHQKKMHERRKRNHRCLMCLKAFYDSQGLRRHINIHTGETKYKCSLCNYVSGEISNFYAHRRKYHAGQECELIKVM